MDNGLDIDECRCVLAYHAAAINSAANLVTLSRAFVAARTAQDSIDATSKKLTNLARSIDCELRWEIADKSLAWWSRPKHHIATIFDREYPALLREIPMPPPVLFVRGNIRALASAQIAVVGSRKPSHSGKEIAFRVARALSTRGFTITSGLANGIDAAAHRGAIDANGSTVAVFGCGIDRIYPARNRELAMSIATTGALVSEFPLGSPPRPYHFPRRNRIISGLSLGTLVVEAAAKSGSISTAMHALDQGREVFAIPGSIRNPMSVGCHRLIKQGATLVDGIEDILEQLPCPAEIPNLVEPTIAPESSRHDEILNRDEQCLLGACEFDPVTFDELVERTGLTTSVVSSILSALEVKGMIQSSAGNSYVKLSP